MSRTFFALALLSSLAGCAGHPAEDTDVITYGDPLPPALDEGEDDTDATNTDTDADGLSDDVEIALGTDPYDADSDDDGLSDGEEVAAGSDPLDPTSGDDGTNDVQVGEPDDTGDTGAPPEDDWVCGTGC